MNLQHQLDIIGQKYGPELEKQFAEAISRIQNDVVLSRVVAAIRNGDYARAVDLLGIENAAFSSFKQSLLAAYNETAAATIAATTWRLPDRSKVVLRWDIDNPRAVEYGRGLSSQKITNLTAQLRQQAADIIADGVANGYGPNRVALDLVGRTGANGVRSGGFIGLSDPQAKWVRNMRARLASGDPVEMRKVFNMVRRDRRLDGIISRAIEAGKPVSAADIDKITSRYKSRLLGRRGEDIARTELANTQATARFDAFNDGRVRMGIPDWAITKKWRHGGGGMHPRDWHVAMAGVTVQGAMTPFVMPDGAMLLHPHDASLGAGAKDLVNCTCTYDITIDYAALYRSGWGG